MRTVNDAGAVEAARVASVICVRLLARTAGIRNVGVCQRFAPGVRKLSIHHLYASPEQSLQRVVMGDPIESSELDRAPRPAGSSTERRQVLVLVAAEAALGIRQPSSRRDRHVGIDE